MKVYRFCLLSAAEFTKNSGQTITCSLGRRRAWGVVIKTCYRTGKPLHRYFCSLVYSLGDLKRRLLTECRKLDHSIVVPETDYVHTRVRLHYCTSCISIITLVTIVVIHYASGHTCIKSFDAEMRCNIDVFKNAKP